MNALQKLLPASQGPKADLQEEEVKTLQYAI